MSNYSKLTFISQFNPLFEDCYHKYSTVRFYSETLISLAKNLKIPEIEILYINEAYLGTDAKEEKEEIARNWFEDLKRDDTADRADYPTLSLQICKRK